MYSIYAEDYVLGSLRLPHLDDIVFFDFPGCRGHIREHFNLNSPSVKEKRSDTFGCEKSAPICLVSRNQKKNTPESPSRSQAQKYRR